MTQSPPNLQPFRLPEANGGISRAHLPDAESDLAIRAALAAGRPLLLCGEPGVGKSQLAAAAAFQLQRHFLSFTVDAKTESSDLLWTFDAVRRLAEAQVCPALGLKSKDEVREHLIEKKFIVPQALWWGFNWANAEQHCRDVNLPTRQKSAHDVEKGCVVLIDEIDKADTDVPNGLLEAMGSGEFTPPGCQRVITEEPTPLVIITTNEERQLPDAFIRRCLVLRMSLPKDPRELKTYLVERGRVHFQPLKKKDRDFTGPRIADNDLAIAADMLMEDREKQPEPPRPGLAEYLDFLRAYHKLLQSGHTLPANAMERIRQFTLGKHTEMKH